MNDRCDFPPLLDIAPFTKVRPRGPCGGGATQQWLTYSSALDVALDVVIQFFRFFRFYNLLSFYRSIVLKREATNNILN